jgi:ATP-dependent Clp protease adaptor protein ClpS
MMPLMTRCITAPSDPGGPRTSPPSSGAAIPTSGQRRSSAASVERAKEVKKGKVLNPFSEGKAIRAADRCEARKGGLDATRCLLVQLGAFAQIRTRLRVALFCQEVSLMDEIITKPIIKDETKVERPRLHKVILLNDDYTPREFVVTVLKAVFRMSEDQALRVMITAHRRGACVVAVYTKDVAEAKATNATDAGRSKGYPLLFTTEPEE